MPVLKNARHEKFAALVASGLSGTEAYIKAGYSPKGARVSASQLLAKPNVFARVEELKERISEKVVTTCIANRSDRLRAMDDRWARMQRLINARAAEMTKDGKEMIAGAGTGLLARTMRSIGSGERAKFIPVFEFDAALIRELRELEKQAAQEVGDWTEKRQITGKDGGPLTVELFDAWLEEADADTKS